MRINVQSFNASGDVIYSDSFKSPDGVLKTARVAFKLGHGIAIEGIDCFTFAEAERAIIRATAQEVVA